MHKSMMACIALGAISAASMITGPAEASAPPRFTLHTLQHDAAQCLTAQPGGGAGFMAPCKDSDGQLWDAYSTNGNFFALRNLNSDDICLESHTGRDPSIQSGGAIYMADCGDFSGQNWYLEPIGNGLFKLKSQLAGPGKCLEGSSRAGRTGNDGTSFMDDCQNVSGQAWAVRGGKVVNGVPVAVD